MDYIQINKLDNVKVSLSDTNVVKKGHKVALKNIKCGEPIIKYGMIIGTATKDIKEGEHVHTQNIKTNLNEKDAYVYEKVSNELPKVTKKTFKGYRRKDGKVGIRNEIWIIPTVGCVNSIAKNIVELYNGQKFKNIDAICTYSHPYGCSQLGDDHENTKKILSSFVNHPNAGGVLVLSLGCENLTSFQFKEAIGNYDSDRVKFLVAQDVSDEIEEGKKLIDELINYASKFEKTDIDACELIVGMKCGGSDGLSGITANPTVGKFSDKLIALGGTTILTEVPEMFGAEKLLFNKCKDKNIFDKAVKMIDDFKSYFIRHGQVVYENPSPGNKEGGISTLEDKSCGCVQKGGTAEVVDILNYGDKVKVKGLNLLSGPGNDIVSSTALAASGAHIILFTTGRGTPLGSIIPTIKISSNTDLYNKKKNWIDFNAGAIIDGEHIDEMSDRLLDLVIDTASGKYTKQESSNAREIAIFKDGVTL